MSHRLLLVSLHPEDQLTARTAAESLGYAVTLCATGIEAVKILLDKTSAESHAADLVLVEKDLADMAAAAWIAMIRKTRIGEDLPIIVVSRSGPSEAQLVELLESGADDVLQAPCAPQELVARMRAVTRRRQAPVEDVLVLEIGPILLDPNARQCRVRGKVTELRPREFELLDLLMKKAGRTLSRAYLLETIWGMDKSANTRAIDVGVSRLRQALGARAGRWIETVERYGYRFRLPEG